jgi:glucose-6-phosphate 1-dehydrogenase
VQIDVPETLSVAGPLLDDPPPVQPYQPGSWGPQPALDRLAAPYRWHLPGVGTR